jgi:hypothetical protein
MRLEAFYMYHEDVWAELASVRRELKSLRATVERLEAADLRSYLWRQHVHDIGKCEVCGEPHECAVVPRGIKSTGGQLTAVCESCYIRRQERQAVMA